MKLFTRKQQSRRRSVFHVIDPVLRFGPGAWFRHRKPIFVLGNQKSGTTVIAALVAEHAGISATLDLRRELKEPTFHRAASGDMRFSRFIAHIWRDFRRELIKEPNLTLFWPQLREYFPGARFVYIVRDPRENIRSILNRLKLPGDLPELSAKQVTAIPPVWRLTIFRSCIPGSLGNYVEQLAHRWNWFNELYGKFSKDTLFVRYEDFAEDKTRKISEIAKSLGLTPEHDISGMVDRQYQPRGDRNVDLGQFFGDNLKAIEKICHPHMKQFEYLPSVRRADNGLRGR